ncbi:unnamed protein product [Pelagomonas calceolata]|uniref:RRM domain-containing protein n=1 Tax=Pelagomonas calceolata TaxID=35677 RepID=A0A8J2STE9_9STRA|nr:unnamed protein product [Pelagomonas calceolata]|mmetsp:Transcript_7320/g.18033  ORF Transcript_7320/g.18033 Transcript_7320/m.18033 type:complete len:396 (+) Transcript_7320:47-1234(+)
MADEQQKAKARAARFANDAKKPPPPPPKKTFAHPGGKMTTNKDEALRKYLERKGNSLNAAQQQALEDLQKKGLAPPTPPKEDRTDKLFVGNLPYKLDDQKLGALFASRYHVIGSKIVLDRQTNRGRGFGFVTFGSSEDAKAAHDAFQGVKVEGRLLTVKYATQRGQSKAKPVLRKDGWGSWATPSNAAAPEAAEADVAAKSSPPAPEASAPAASAPEAASATDEKPLESETPVEAVSLWKIATSSEVDAWRAAGTLTGSALDEKDGFVHCATADQARVVADLYFAGQSNLKLLRVSVESLKQKDTAWTRESDASLKGRPGVAVRLVPAEDIKKYRNGKDVLHDGCLHLHAAPPLPWSLVDEFELPLVDGKHAFPAQCVATEGPRAQALGGFSITY